MKFILTKKQFDFLITLDNVNNFILKHSFENNNAIFFVDDISSFQDIIYFNVVEYGMDKEGAINSKGKQIYAVAFRTKREKFSHKIEKVRFCKNV